MTVHLRDVDTDVGIARLHQRTPRATEIKGTLLLGHGAGGGVNSADLQALSELDRAGWHTVLIEQPWRVAGRRIAVPPAKLDLATRQIVDMLRSENLLPRPWVLGGRSAGARVACRLSEYAQACVLIAFPLVPVRKDGTPGPSRAGELMMPLHHGIPTLVVQGDRDRFGGPSDVAAVAPGARVASYPGDHAVTRDPPALSQAVARFLDALT